MARKNVPLRIDPAVYEAIARWAADDLPRRGRPRKDADR